MGVPALAQLAVRVRSEVMLGADPFAKVKQMIQEMMEKLLAEAKEEAGKKAFCDKEMAETKAKRDDEQGEIAAEQKVANEIRANEKAAWAEAKSDFEQGLEGVQMALQVLRDYYEQKVANEIHA